jgi:hypothetical protein
MDRPRTSLRAKLLLLLGGTLVGLLVVEISLRLVGFEHGYPELYMSDPVLGARLRPHAAGWWTSEGRQYIRISSQGLRDREHSRDKAAATLRVAVLGDSYAEALQVALEDTFWSVMADQLERCPDLGYQSVEALNFGVSGYGTGQELLTLRHRVWELSPDIVLLTVVTGNDLRNNSSELATDKLRPFFELSQPDRALTLDSSFLDSPEMQQRLEFERRPANRARRFLRAHLRTYQLLSRLKAGRQVPAEAPGPASPAPGSLQEPGLDDWVYLPPEQQPAWHHAWQLTTRLVEEIHRETVAHGATLVLVTLSNPIQLEPDSEKRAAFLDAMGPQADLFAPDRRFKALADELGIEAVILAPALHRHAVEHRVYLHGFERSGLGRGHWNEAGHHLAGTLIAEHLCHLQKEQLPAGFGDELRFFSVACIIRAAIRYLSTGVEVGGGDGLSVRQSAR